MCSWAAFGNCLFSSRKTRSAGCAAESCWCSASLFPGVQIQPATGCLGEKERAVPGGSARWAVLMISVRSHIISRFEKEK